MNNLETYTTNNPLLDVIYNETENSTTTKPLEEEFHDACSLGENEVNANECGDEFFEVSDAFLDNKDKAQFINEEPIDSRVEIENKLSQDELESRKSKAISLKEDGNAAFKRCEFETALIIYTDAIDICPIRFSEELAKLFSNRAACHSQMGSREAALGDCDEALKLSPDYMRCLIRRAELRESSERFSDALVDYQHIIKLDPSNYKARANCALLPAKIEAQQEKMKAEMMGQLKQLGNMCLKPFGLSTDNFKLTKDPNSGGYSVNFVRESQSS